jgi:hypothetical protein
VQHALGIAALTAGRVDQAVEHLRAAVRRNLVLQHRPAVLMSRARYAQALARRGGPDDLALAREILVVAAQEADRLACRCRTSATAAGRAAGGHLRPRRPAVAAPVRPAGTCGLPATVGIAHLAVLLGNPAATSPPSTCAAGLAAVRLDRRAGPAAAGSRGTRQYRQRVAELEARIDDLTARDRHDDATAAVAERDWLLGELAAATGLGRRARTFTTTTSAPGLSVSKAIHRR